MTESKKLLHNIRHSAIQAEICRKNATKNRQLAKDWQREHSYHVESVKEFMRSYVKETGLTEYAGHGVRVNITGKNQITIKVKR
jgi:hypothetical protein